MPSLQKVAGAVLVFGSIFFLIAAFLPISRVFALSDPADQLAIIRSERGAWTFAQIFFAVGAIVTAIGLALTALQFGAGPGSGLLYLGATAALIGAGLWTWYVYLRAVDPAAFTAGLLPAWQFASYTVLTQAGLVAAGAAFIRQSEMADWLGWMLILGMLALFLAYLIFKDMPPFVYYLLTLLVGVMVFRLE